MIYTGGGIVLGEASKSLTEFVRLLVTRLPTRSWASAPTRRATRCSSACSVCTAPMKPTWHAQLRRTAGVGARFDDRVTGELDKFCPDARIIHIDIDPASISKNVPVEIPVVGAADSVLKDMIKQLKGAKRKPDKTALAAWWKQIDEWRSMNCYAYDRKSKLIKPQYVIEKLHELTLGDAFVTSDVGQHQMWAAQFYKFNKPRRWINSGGLGTWVSACRGHGVQLAFPDETVACVTARLDPDVHSGTLDLQAV